MKRKFVRGFLVGVVLCLFTACPTPPPEGDCGGETCSEDKICDRVALLCVDNTDPVVTITAPAAGAALTGKTLTVSGQITDDENQVPTTEISINGGDTWTSLARADDGSFSIDLPMPELDAKPLTIQVRAKDRLDQQGLAEISATVDNVGPACEAKFDPAHALAIKDGPKFNLQYSVTDGSGTIAKKSLLVDNNAVEVQLAEGLATFDWTLPSDADGTLIPVVFHAEDPSGNACDLSAQLVVDQVAPVIEVTAPADAAMLGGGDSEYTFTGTVTSGNDAPPTVSLDFGDGMGERAAEVTDGTWSLTIPLPKEDFQQHQVTVRASDEAGNSDAAELAITVDTVAPQLAITGPAAEKKFNISDLGSSGLVPLTWTVTDGDSTLTTEFRSNNGSWATANGAPSSIATAATDNGTTYNVDVKVRDQTGNETTKSVQFYVDRVAPALVQTSIANNTRMNPPRLDLTFNEPVTFTNNNSLLTPPDGTRTGALDTFSITSLKGGTVYTFSLPANSVHDDFGNSNAVVSPISFHTEPAIPTSGTAITFSAVALSSGGFFDVASDEDGVTTIAWRSGNSSVSWTEFDPETGSPTSMTGTAYSLMPYNLSVVAHRELNGLAAVRNRGYVLETTSTSSPPLRYEYGYWASGNSTAQAVTNATETLVPVPSGCRDPAGGAAVGEVTNAGQYMRGGTTPISQASGLNKAFAVAAPSANTWVTFGLDSSQAPAMVERKCGCLGGLGSGCGFGPVRSFGGNTPTSMSWSTAYVSGGLAAVVYDDLTGRYQKCISPCGASNFCTVPTAPTTVTLPTSEGLTIGPKWDGTKILGAKKTALGVELLEADLGSGCPASTDWTSLGVVPSSTSASLWRPAVFGKKAGVVYLTGTTLKIWHQ